MTELTITNAETLKVLYDPQRMRLMEELVSAENAGRTVKELAAALGVPATRLYHHVNLLEEHALIRVAETRLVSGIQEKRYAAVARSYRIDRSLVGGGALDETIEALLDTVRTDITDAFAAGLVAADEQGARGLTLVKSRLQLSPERAAELKQRLRDLYDEYDDGPRDVGPDAAAYGVLIGVYPLARGGSDA